MSLAPSTKTHKTVLTPLTSVKFNLNLTEELVEKIKILHNQVKTGTEWSGILVYKVASGSILAIDTLEIEAIDVIPMDIGSATYTEYDYDAEDEYSFERIVDYMTNGYKIGHIHSHHSMGCFFSGTDTDELHENAPNHNYYLSLIVNYKDHTQWCAKIAWVGEEVQEVKSSYNFKLLPELNTDREPTTVTRELLFTADAAITTSVQVSDQYTYFTDRIAELAKPKAVTTTYNNHITTPGYRGNNNHGLNAVVKKIKKFDNSDYSKIGILHNTMDIYNASIFLKNLLNGHETIDRGINESITQTVNGLIINPNVPEDIQYFEGMMEDAFEKLILSFYGAKKINSKIAYIVAFAIIKVIKLYNYAFDNKSHIRDSIYRVLEPYLLSEHLAKDEELTHVTGIFKSEIATFKKSIEFSLKNLIDIDEVELAEHIPANSGIFSDADLADDGYEQHFPLIPSESFLD